MKLKCNIPSTKRLVPSLPPSPIFPAFSITPVIFHSCPFLISRSTFTTHYSIPIQPSRVICLVNISDSQTTGPWARIYCLTKTSQNTPTFRCQSISLVIPFPFDLDSVKSSDRGSTVSTASKRIIQWQTPFMDGNQEKQIKLKVKAACHQTGKTE